MAIGNEAANDALANALGLKKGDIILAMNGDKFPAYGPELNAFLGVQVQKIPGLETFTMTVWREVDGEGKEVKLSATNQQVEVQIPLGLQFTENPSEEQLKFRDYWLKPAR